MSPPARNLVLCGFMGTGKSAVAAALARLYHLEVVDTDAAVEAASKATVAEIFRRHGEAEFRRREHAAVVAAAARRGVVIATGGGVPLDPANLEALRATGVLFLLEASPAALARRLAGDTTRPLLPNQTPAAIAAVLAARSAAYGAIAARVATEGRSIDEVAREVYSRFLGRLRGGGPDRPATR